MPATYEPARQNSNDNAYPFQANTEYDSNTNTTVAPSTYHDPKAVEEARLAGRTPSPTPSELKELQSGAINWKSFTKWRFWIRREWLWYYVIFIVILTITALVTIYHKQIVTWLTPATRWLSNLKAGWLVPIAILFVISFPPLFGHEIVAILCGLVWGLWIGFAIVCAGTFVGEVGNFYAFKYCCRARGEKLERTRLSYACLAKVVRDGGFKIALIARLSAIPGHFTTAIFSTCGMNIFVFCIAAILSLPKQFITVYLGVILEQSNTGVTDKKSTIISDVVLAITFLITILAMWYIIHEMNKAKPQVIYERRKARQGKLARSGHHMYSASEAESTSTIGFNPNGSDSDIPLTEAGQARYQQWDKHGNAVGYAPDPNLYAPAPRRASVTPFKQQDASHARQSTVEVDWDMGAMQNPHAHASPRASASSSPRPAGAAPARADSDPRHRHPYPNAPFNASTEYTQTPTQASFGGQEWHEPVTPTPQTYAYSSPFDASADPYARRGHAQEPTDVTFRTAFTSSPMHDDEVQNQQAARRAASPPPPSYMTNLR